MNQILVIDKKLIINNKSFKHRKYYLLLFLISISIGMILSYYLLHCHFLRLSDIKKTNILRNKYNINTLYSSKNNYSTIEILNDVSIIGLIEIPKINVSYPIIENTNDNLLKISVCKFSGPLPNRIGNLCIAGHNYKNNSMFSNLYKINIGDFIYITDLNNTKIKYTIYQKFIVEENNLDCTKNSNNVQITLITCYNFNNSKRLVIKAKMEG